MAFFDSMFGGSTGASPMIGGQGGATSAFSPNGSAGGGITPQMLAILSALQNRSTPGAAPVGGAVPGAAGAPGPPQMPAPPGGAPGGMGAPAGLAALAAQHGMPGGATAMPAGATGAPGGGNLMQMLMSNPQLMKMVSQGKAGPGAAGVAAGPSPGTGGLY